MNKHEFLTQLRAKLWNIPQEDAQRSVDYYAEMIDDRMDEGLAEEEAVAAIGDLEEIVKDILAETPAAPVVAAQPPKTHRSMRAWEIVLLIVGAPLWLTLLIAATVVILSVYVTLWSVVISLYAAAVALGVASIGCVIGSFFVLRESGAVLATIGAALLCAGLMILMFMLSNLAAKGMVALTKLTAKGIKRIFTGKELKV